MSTATTLVTIVRRATSTTSATPAATSDSGGSNTSNQTPFLYFIALGLGIVFTNLWVILGLKYCFRNRRRRAMLAQNGGVEIDSLTGGPDDFGFYMNPLLGPEFSRRRRRERRLMKSDELNERFPVMKYKAWGAEREKMGLPTEGGISAEAAAMSRPASIMEDRMSVIEDDDEIDRVTLNQEQQEGEGGPSDGEPAESRSPEHSSRPPSIDLRAPLTQSSRPPSIDLRAPPTPPPEGLPMSKSNVEITEAGEPEAGETDADESDRDDMLQARQSTSHSYDDEYRTTLVPPEVAEEPGDLCAICLDSIEPEHDIRALGCSHVFHDECITPWLTTRRACCPLCKMDFSSARYRAEQAAAAAISLPEDAHVHEDSNVSAAAATEAQPGTTDNENNAQVPRRANFFARILAPESGVPRRNFVRIPYS